MEDALLRRLADESDIRDVIFRYAEGIDQRSWDSVQSCFAETIEADFTAAGYKEVFRGPCTKWVNGIKEINLGMDATMHQITNVRVHVTGDSATASSYFYVTHMLANSAGDNHYVVGGFYNYEFLRIEETWRIIKYGATMHLRMGNTYIFKLASSRGAKVLANSE